MCWRNFYYEPLNLKIRQLLTSDGRENIFVAFMVLFIYVKCVSKIKVFWNKYDFKIKYVFIVNIFSWGARDKSVSVYYILLSTL